MCKIFIPSLEYNKNSHENNQNFFKPIFQIHIVIIISIISFIIFLNDSPRNLILTNEYEEAKNILNYYTDNVLTDEEFEKIKFNLLYDGENKFYDKNSGIKEIFNPRIRSFTILMMIIFIFISFGFSGVNTVIADILKILYLNKKNSFYENKETIFKEKDPIQLLIIIKLMGR